MPANVNDTTTGAFTAVGAASAQFSATIATGERWMLTSSTACWVALGTNPTASKAAGSFFLPATIAVQVVGGAAGGTKVAVIQDAAGGNASLVRVVS